ncbi:isoaspartyl peptidase/L-asparaginase-like [Dendronephthya gigantea]|uniref:isoaspartyl peptidase/L-asparaginase-like n=1 Tax=Dendronephthya gigantea TaxID=151771 RepID=UPI00106A6D17|nr:isoaspartyl peptidase/L-asparaginase-like [Dendronephthya gigantea]
MAEKPTPSSDQSAIASNQGTGDFPNRGLRIIIVHGGLYNRLLKEKGLMGIFMKGIEEAAKKGYQFLEDGGTAVDAVEAAVRHLEEDVNFNAGRGSFLNSKNKVECDAMIMDGKTLEAGAVMAVRHFQHPVMLSRAVMEKSEHCVLCADGAYEFAQSKGFASILDDPDDLIVLEGDEEKNEISMLRPGVVGGLDQYSDSVAAVAIDSKGNFACAMSTGGTPKKLKGRVGDVPLIGCGGYANDYATAAACGHGESIIKMTLAKEIVYNIERGQNAQEAARNAVERMNSEDRVTKFAGVIAIDKQGNMGIETNATFMPWVSIRNGEMDWSRDE